MLVAEVARALRISKSSVYRRVKDGTLPYERYGGIRIPRYAIEKSTGTSHPDDNNDTAVHN